MGKILFLDDEAPQHRLMHRLIKDQEIDSAFKLPEALNLYSKNKYHLIITDRDITYTGEGIDLIKTLRKDYYINSELTPILMISGAANLSTYNIIKEYGAVGLIQKPFNSKELKDICSELIKNKESNTLEKYLKEKIKNEW